MANSNIGTQDEADTALLTHLYYWENSTMTPGWRYLGSGVHRYAYSSPSGHVYKIPSEWKSEACRKANLAEAEGARTLSGEKSDEFGVPSTNLFTVAECPVIVMENLGDEKVYLDKDQAARAQAFFRNTDCHAGNMRMGKDGKVYMIDLGFFSTENKASLDCCIGFCGEAGCCCGC